MGGLGAGWPMAWTRRASTAKGHRPCRRARRQQISLYEKEVPIAVPIFRLEETRHRLGITGVRHHDPSQPATPPSHRQTYAHHRHGPRLDDSAQADTGTRRNGCRLDSPAIRRRAPLDGTSVSPPVHRQGRKKPVGRDRRSQLGHCRVNFIKAGSVCAAAQQRRRLSELRRRRQARPSRFGTHLQVAQVILRNIEEYWKWLVILMNIDTY